MYNYLNIFIIRCIFRDFPKPIKHNTMIYVVMTRHIVILKIGKIRKLNTCLP